MMRYIRLFLTQLVINGLQRLEALQSLMINRGIHYLQQCGLWIRMGRNHYTDKTGNEWTGTWNGLGDFNGSNWVKFTTSNSGLLSNDISSITVDESNNKWIGTQGGGLTRI